MFVIRFSITNPDARFLLSPPLYWDALRHGRTLKILRNAWHNRRAGKATAVEGNRSAVMCDRNSQVKSSHCNYCCCIFWLLRSHVKVGSYFEGKTMYEAMVSLYEGNSSFKTIYWLLHM